MLKKSEDVFIQKLGEELIIHSNITDNTVFLNETAAQIYEFVNNNNKQNIINKLNKIYDIDSSSIEDEVEKIIQFLIEEGVINYEENEIL